MAMFHITAYSPGKRRLVPYKDGRDLSAYLPTREATKDIVAVLKKHKFTDIKVQGPGTRWRVAYVVPQCGSTWLGWHKTFRTEAEARKELGKQVPQHVEDLTVVAFEGEIVWQLEDL